MVSDDHSSALNDSAYSWQGQSVFNCSNEVLNQGGTDTALKRHEEFECARGTIDDQIRSSFKFREFLRSFSDLLTSQ